MTNTTSETRFRQAAEAENGMPISAGARVAHVRLAVESGRAVVVELSSVPEANRTALIAEIKELVRKASIGSTILNEQAASEQVASNPR